MLKDLSKEAQSHLIIVSSALLIILIVSVIIGKGYLVYVSRKNVSKSLDFFGIQNFTSIKRYLYNLTLQFKIYFFNELSNRKNK